MAGTCTSDAEQQILLARLGLEFPFDDINKLQLKDDGKVKQSFVFKKEGDGFSLEITDKMLEERDADDSTEGMSEEDKKKNAEKKARHQEPGTRNFSSRNSAS